MSWEQRVVRYLKSFGYEALGFESGLVVYKDLNGKAWRSNKVALNRNMIEWENI